MFGAPDDRLHLRHDLIVRDAGALRRHRPLDLGPEPRIMRRRILAGRELGLDGGEVSHAGNVADWGGGWKGDATARHGRNRAVPQGWAGVAGADERGAAEGSGTSVNCLFLPVSPNLLSLLSNFIAERASGFSIKAYAKALTLMG